MTYTTPARRGYTAADGTRSTDAPSGWPFGFSPEGQRNHDACLRAVREIAERDHRARVAAAYRAQIAAYRSEWPFPATVRTDVSGAGLDDALARDALALKRALVAERLASAGEALL